MTPRSADALRHARVKALFGQAVELLPGLRHAFLDRECGGDLDLRRELEDLLRHAEAADDGFLAEPPRLTTTTVTPTRFDLPGFRLLERRGEGASGVVFRAEQVRPRREVAVKVLRLDTLAPGMRARFQREAELLARLSHPGIAEVLEAGVADTDAGPVPWIALEYVHGVDLMTYVRRTKPTTDVVLGLFVELCRALQHAHERAVVHLDLKPSNVLVDEAGRVKVLDFGIARSLADERAAEELTRSGLVLGTLAYMPPEQARGERRAIGASADVYALGVMLFEALTGALPIEVDDTRVLEGVRTVCEDAPHRLRALRADLPKDLETVVLETLHKEPGLRYTTAGELADDLVNLLEHRPIRAKRLGLVYRAKKFVRRNLIVTSAALAVIASLASALTIALRGLEAERSARARTSDTLEGITAKIFDLVPRIGFGEEQRAALEDVAGRIAEQLVIDPSNDALRSTRAQALFELAALDVMGRHGPTAMARLDETRAILEDVLTRRPSSTELRSLLSRTYAKLGDVAGRSGDIGAQRGWFERTFALDQRLVAEHPDDGELVEDLGWSLYRLSQLAFERGEVSTARALSERRLTDARALVAREPRHWKYVSNLSHALWNVAQFEQREGDLEVAADLATESVRLARELLVLQPARRDFIDWNYFACQLAMHIAEVRNDSEAASRYAQLRCQAALDLAFGEPTTEYRLGLLQDAVVDSVRLGLALGDWPAALRSSRRFQDTVEVAREAGVDPEVARRLASRATELLASVAAARPRD